MMNKEEYLLDCLSEECAELAQVASKSIRFGLNNKVPGVQEEKTNTDDLITEYLQVVAVMEMLQELGSIPNIDYRKASNIKKNKKEKVNFFMKKYFGKSKGGENNNA